MDLFKRAQSEETRGGFHPTSSYSSSTTTTTTTTTIFVGPLLLDLGQRTTQTDPRGFSPSIENRYRGRSTYDGYSIAIYYRRVQT